MDRWQTSWLWPQAARQERKMRSAEQRPDEADTQDLSSALSWLALKDS